MNRINAFNFFDYTSKATSGYKMFLRSFMVPRAKYQHLEDEPPWDTNFVRKGTVKEELDLYQFNYAERDIHSYQGRKDKKAIAKFSNFLTQEGIEVLSEICQKLQRFSSHNDMVISQRLRAADRYSSFIYNMLRDKEFLIQMSSLVGVPLIPHPHRNVTAQINYYSLERNPEAKWHIDGPDYVFTMLLNDGSDFEGGDLTFFKDTKEKFDSSGIREENLYKPDLRTKGDMVFARGSHLYHCVTPLISGNRNTLSFSLFSPFLAKYDSSRFWWSAPEDGFFDTLNAWSKFKFFNRKPEYYARLVGSPLIQWNELEALRFGNE